MYLYTQQVTNIDTHTHFGAKINNGQSRNMAMSWFTQMISSRQPALHRSHFLVTIVWFLNVRWSGIQYGKSTKASPTWWWLLDGTQQHACICGDKNWLLHCQCFLPAIKTQFFDFVCMLLFYQTSKVQKGYCKVLLKWPTAGMEKKMV